jgi:hypothetical protein
MERPLVNRRRVVHGFVILLFGLFGTPRESVKATDAAGRFDDESL